VPTRILKILDKIFRKIFCQISQYSIKWNLGSLNNFSLNNWGVYEFNIASLLKYILRELIQLYISFWNLWHPKQIECILLDTW